MILGFIVSRGEIISVSLSCRLLFILWVRFPVGVGVIAIYFVYLCSSVCFRGVWGCVCLVLGCLVFGCFNRVKCILFGFERSCGIAVVIVLCDLW